MYRGGGSLLGKLATFEFALGGPSYDLPWPPARNPWSLDHMPGGSSSGAGAASPRVFCAGDRNRYRRLGPLAGGGVRIVGLKPTYGLVSRRGVLPNTFSMDHCGPLARTVEDCALALQAIAGYDAADPGSIAVTVPDYRAALAVICEALGSAWWRAGTAVVMRIQSLRRR